MPKVRKLSPDEVRTIERKSKGQRRLIEEEYDAFLRPYEAGEYGEAELEENDNRVTVRNRLKAAANRRGMALEFKRTKGDTLRFRVLPKGSVVDDADESSTSNEPAPVSADQPPPELAAGAPAPARKPRAKRKTAE